ncbi:MAG: D-xylose transport system substrate-binding protein [Solirubrobacterales bacterium]|jgi:D-xylose transport system substrate-binding protein|nr:D-xylose transport system substrate-binding protein [Solirubrobacterales bacterium]
MRSLLVALAALCAALAIGACGDDDDGGDSGSDSGGGGKIAFLLPESQTARYEALDKPLFEAKVEELCPDCELLYQNADQDPAKQQQQVEAAITEEVDVMVLDPVDSTTAGALATRAKDAGIPVISYDRLILDADLDYYVQFDSVEVGRQQATALSEEIAANDAAEGPIVKINGDPKDNNAALFKEGSNEVFEEEGVEIAEEVDTPDWLPENAQQEMEGMITSVGADEIVGVYAANDGTAGGAIAAMKANGMDPTEIPVTGQDAELTAVQRILAGEQFMTVYKPYGTLAAQAAEIAVAVANGEDPPSDLINSETDNGTENVPTASTDTIAVTVDNVADTIVADELYPVEDICTDEYAKACSEAGIE